MSNDEPQEGYCNAQTRDGGYCGRKVSSSDDRCYMHGGATPTKEENPDVGPPEGVANAETHGLTSDAQKWFERHRDDVEDDVKQMVDDWMELAPFGWGVSGNVRMLTNAAINECQIEGGDQYIEENGAIVQEMIPAGEGVIQQDEANPAFLYKSRLQKDTIRILKEFNILDSPDSQKAEAQQDIADAWREALSE